MKITKFKCKVKNGIYDIQIEYYTPNKTAGVDDFKTLKSKEAPKNELLVILQKIREHAIAIAKLPLDWFDNLTVIGFTVCHDGSNGITITTLRKIDGLSSPLVINTPFCTNEIYSDSCAEDIARLCHEIKRYIQGCRAQGNLFLEEAK